LMPYNSTSHKKRYCAIGTKFHHSSAVHIQALVSADIKV